MLSWGVGDMGDRFYHLGFEFYLYEGFRWRMWLLEMAELPMRMRQWRRRVVQSCERGCG